MASSLILELEMGPTVALLLLTLASAVGLDASSSVFSVVTLKKKKK